MVMGQLDKCDVVTVGFTDTANMPFLEAISILAQVRSIHLFALDRV